MLEEQHPHMWPALSRLRFQGENGRENMKIRRIELYKTFAEKPHQDSILSGILERIRNNVWSNCTIAEGPFKGAHELMVEEGHYI